MRIALLLLALAPLAAAAAAAPQASRVPPAQAQSFPPIAARGRDTELAWERFDRLLVDRHAMSETGRDALKHLLRARLLERLAQESRLEVGAPQVEARWRELDAEIRASGDKTGLQGYLRESGVDPDVFREFLRLSIVQETLARRALGIPAGRPVPADQQEMWLDQIIAQRGTQMPPPPWEDGVAARCGDLELPVRDYLLHLRGQLPPEDVRQDCHQLLLEQRVRARMPDLAPAALERAIDAELERRRAEVAADPRYKGLTYEQIAGAQGVRLDSLRRDPAIVVAALSELWVDRTYGDQGVRDAYRTERDFFDGRFGETVEARVLFLRAAVLRNDLNPRSFEEAREEAARIARGVRTLEDFVAAVRRHSEDPATRERGGLMGPIARGDARVPEELRVALFGAGDPEHRLLAPVKLDGGVALVWAGARAAAPPWERMEQHVRRELRRRFLEEVLPESEVLTYLEGL